MTDLRQAPPSDLMARAVAARREGRMDEAAGLLTQLLDRDPGHGPALNLLGLVTIAAGDPAAAARLFERAAAIEPGATALWLNLASAHRAAGLDEAELNALDRALAIDAYLVPALLAKGAALRRLSRADAAFVLYRGVLPGLAGLTLPPPLAAAVEEAQAFVREEGGRRVGTHEDRLAELLAALSPAEAVRARGFVDERAGRRQVYVQQPASGHFPYLPAFEFFDPALFPWFGELEAATDLIRRELLGVWESAAGARPYVQFDPAMPVNQWKALNNSPDWSAWFLWENGVPHEENIARCPETATLVRRLPLLDTPGKAPTAMFSVLKPRTRIPAHTGSTNIRATVHLPLVVPDGCGFRVGSETRRWEVGTAWAFDDTIEHEAWNDSDLPRAILILDSWNPLLSEAERAVCRIVG